MNKIVLTMNYRRPCGGKLEYHSNDMITDIQTFSLENAENSIELVEKMCDTLNVKFELREEI